MNSNILLVIAVGVFLPCAAAQKVYESSLGLVVTDVTVTTLLTPNGFQLRMSKEAKSGTYLLDSVTVRWRNIENNYLKKSLPRIETPALANLNIFAATGSEGKEMILLIPFGMHKPKGKVDGPQRFDAARLIFFEGKLIKILLAEAVRNSNDEWRISEFEEESNSKINVRIEKSLNNPFLK